MVTKLSRGPQIPLHQPYRTQGYNQQQRCIKETIAKDKVQIKKIILVPEQKDRSEQYLINH